MKISDFGRYALGYCVLNSLRALEGLPALGSFVGSNKPVAPLMPIAGSGTTSTSNTIAEAIAGWHGLATLWYGGPPRRRTIVAALALVTGRKAWEIARAGA